MNILVITPFYKHDRNIASVRWTNIATRLAKHHNVIVVTQPHDDMDMSMSISKDEDNVLVARINQKTAYEKFAVRHFGAATGDDWQTQSNSNKATQNSNSKESFKRIIKNRALFASMKQKARSYAKTIKKQVIPSGTKIDVVISSACPFIEMLFGYELKKHLNCKWICDFRDLPFYDNKTDSTKMMSVIMKKTLIYSDKITVVSPGMVNDLERLIEIPSTKIDVVTNGFSKTDYCECSYVHRDNALHLGFTGTLYSDGSEFSMLLDALNECKKIRSDFEFVIDCAGGNSYLIPKIASKYGFVHCVQDIGFVSRADALALQRKSDLLLAFTNVSRGGFAAKLFEYLLCKKPIINIVYGTKTGSDSKRFISELNIGIAAEEGFKGDKEALINYLLLQFDRKHNGLPMYYEPITEKISRYDHDNIAIQVESIIKNIM